MKRAPLKPFLFAATLLTVAPALADGPLVQCTGSFAPALAPLTPTLGTQQLSLDRRGRGGRNGATASGPTSTVHLCPREREPREEQILTC